MNTLQLLGLKHTGKSTLGRLWAHRHGWDFYDLDSLLETRSGDGRTSRQIFQDQGKEGFQKLETDAARFIAPRLAEGRAVLAWGGGTIANTEAVQTLKGLGFLVVIEERIEVLYERILKSGRPAFLSADHPWRDFQKIHQERMALFKALTPWRIDLAGASPHEALEQLQTLWNTLPHSGNS